MRTPSHRLQSPKLDSRPTPAHQVATFTPQFPCLVRSEAADPTAKPGPNKCPIANAPITAELECRRASTLQFTIPGCMKKEPLPDCLKITHIELKPILGTLNG